MAISGTVGAQLAAPTSYSNRFKGAASLRPYIAFDLATAHRACGRRRVCSVSPAGGQRGSQWK
jgi:hypothetical protein